MQVGLIGIGRGLNETGMHIDIKCIGCITRLAKEAVVVEISSFRTSHTALIVIKFNAWSTLLRFIHLAKFISPLDHPKSVIVTDHPVIIGEIRIPRDGRWA